MNVYLRNLHVVTKLEVSSELKRLDHGDITPGLEHHHGYSLAGKGIADDQLSDDIQTNLVVRDSLDHSDRNDVDERNDLNDL